MSDPDIDTRPIGTPHPALDQWQSTLNALDFTPEPECDYTKAECRRPAQWRIRCVRCRCWAALCASHHTALRINKTPMRCPTCALRGLFADIFHSTPLRGPQ